MAEVVGKNGVVITKRAPHDGESYGYRTYEVYQRERVGESTEKIKPIQLVSNAYRQDPYPLVAILRENYPCYRDWLSNSYWITQYNDVTSIFSDDANFETRPNSWYYGMEIGRNLANELSVLAAEEAFTDNNAGEIAGRVVNDLLAADAADLATGFAATFSMRLLGGLLAIPDEELGEFSSRYWRMHRGVSFEPTLQEDGRRAISELISYFEPIAEARRASPSDDLVSVMLQCEPCSAADIVATLLERDHETLQGALANLWFQLLTNPGALEQARQNQRLMKLAYLETLRHSAPVITAHRFARHEVERFGKLIPEGARLTCSAAAANRDPRIFNDPDTFIVDRRDMCQREPRGQYRADGLASGIAFRLGKPSKHPAVPEDRARSRYALTRDTAVTASQVLSELCADIRLAEGANPHLASLTVGEMHTCWKLPVGLTTR